ncbi:MAG: alpha/beta hydrolase [Treponema sp.]|jgi:acetyl esterase/lipase|nr:alpha/beta hydrolase [Treponema sp.]
MLFEKHEISTGGGAAAPLYVYLLDNSREIDPRRRRPLVLICPGGGYEMTSDREAEPIAMQLLAAGFHAAILRYSVRPAIFPEALCQLAASAALLRSHAAAWNIDPERVFVLGCSAGGHLAASLGVFWNKGLIEQETGLKAAEFRPNGLVLVYPVISSGEYAHRGSMEALLGGLTDDTHLAMMALENQVDQETPPAFLWHTWEDDCVPVENSLMFAAALRKNRVPFEMHIYQYGGHGLSLATPETGNSGAPPNVPGWIDLAANWIRAFKA